VQFTSGTNGVNWDRAKVGVKSRWTY